MALNYHPSCSFLVSDDWSAAMMRGCGCWSEEASPLSSIGVNSLWWDDFEDLDPVDLLPTDPFGMNFETTLTAALATCSDLSNLLNQALALTVDPLRGTRSSTAFEAAAAPFARGGLSGGAACAQSQRLPPLAEPSGEEDPSPPGDAALMSHDTAGAAPHDAMVFALRYLGLRDLLAVEMVCKSLHAAVRGDDSLWKCIHVDPVLSAKVSDPDLLCLTQKIPGVLQCLNIDDCIHVTDKGLNAVLGINPKLTKLSIARCPRLTLDGLIANLKSFNMKEKSGIKSLRIDKNFNLPEQDYEELLSLLNIDKMQELHNRAPRFRHANHFLSGCEDGYALDIEMCPICQSYKLVFDCPEEGCSDRRSGNCRACEVCIKRCRQCGRCLERNEKFEEKFDLDYLCYKCRGDPASSLAVEKDLVSILSSGRIPSP
ncbi:F-box protein SKIP14 [Lolium perenne]|uniref:F-box protein SKIP14 n=1 Tax=Lolium perenne TaxID=4522 RepID=UPI0021F55F32|nr:F-box protein SKIP14-like [Lolium perenne]